MSSLPPARVPFPVKPVYRISPEMVRLGQPLFGETQREHFIVDARLPEYTEQKLELLTGHPELCRCLVPLEGAREASLMGALWHIFELLAGDHPAYVQMTTEGVRLELFGLELRRPDAEPMLCPGAPFGAMGERVAHHLQRQAGVRRLADALALAVQEDLVLMRDLGEADEAELLHVCFPSYWNPATRVGQDFAAIHRPVAHSEVLVKASSNLMKALFTKGPFLRFVWSLTPDARLSQNPDLPGRNSAPLALDDPGRLARQLHFRVERQTTYALPELERALFTIRIFVQPLREALSTLGRRQLLAQALRSMDEELLAYKSLTEVKEPLLAWLERQA